MRNKIKMDHKQVLSTFVFLYASVINIWGQSTRFNISYPNTISTHSIQADSTGKIWYLDGYSFYSYNGHQTKEYSLSSIEGIADSLSFYIGDIIFEKDKLFISLGNEIGYFDPQTSSFTGVWTIPADHEFDYVYEDDLKNIWVFTTNTKNNTRPVFRSEDRINFSLVFDFKKYYKLDAYNFYEEFSDVDGTLYIHQLYGGLVLIDKNGNEVNFPVKDQEDFDRKKECGVFRVDNLNTLWRIYQDSFEYYDAVAQTFQLHPLTGSTAFESHCSRQELLPTLQVIYRDSRNGLWIGLNNSMLFLFEEDTYQRTSFYQELNKNAFEINGYIKSIHEDKDGNIWGNRRDGLFKIREKENYFKSYAVGMEDSENELYKKTDNPAIKFLNDTYGELGISRAEISSIQEDKNGNIYFNDNRFIFKVDATTDKLEVLPFYGDFKLTELFISNNIKIFTAWYKYFSFEDNKRIEFDNPSVLILNKIFQQKNGNLWFVGHNNNLFKIDTSTLLPQSKFVDPKGKIDISKMHIVNLDENEAGHLLLSTKDGIYEIHPQIGFIKKITNEYSYKGQNIILESWNNISYVENQLLWFNSENQSGLIDLESNTLKHYFYKNQDHQQGHPTTFTAFCAQGDSVMWSSDMNALSYHNFNTEEHILFSKEEGINTLGKILTFTKLADGKIAAGTANGLYIFHPDTLVNNYQRKKEIQSKVAMQLTAYSVFNSKSDSSFTYNYINHTGEKVELNYNDKLVEFEYALGNLNFPNRQRYSYKMEGFDLDWSTPQNENHTKYTSLPPGDYTFKVKGTVGTGIWSDQILSIPVVVHEAWFRKGWFYLLCLTATGLLVYLMARYYIINALEKRLTIERLRNKISSDLHDDVGSVLSVLAMQAEVMVHDIKNITKDELNKLSTMSREAMSKMRDIVWAMDATKDKYENLLDRMNYFADSTFSKTEITHSFEVVNIKEDQFVSPDVRRNLYLIFKEAMTNITKHSNGDNVVVKLERVNDQLSLSILDNGKNSEKLKSDGQGLSNIRMRAEKIGGWFSMNNTNGFGIEVGLTL